MDVQLDMIDAMGLVHDALSADFPQVYVSPDFDTSIEFPAFKYLTSSEGQVGNGPGLWVVDLDMSIITTAAQINDLMRAAYRAVHSWQGRTFPQAHVNRVNDTTTFSYAGTSSFSTKTLIQYSGSFELICRTI